MKQNHFEINESGTDYFAGDLHGCYEVFMNGLATVGFDFDNDRVFCVGDLIDRGPDSIKCLHLLTKSWFHSVLGNHEMLMLGSHGQHVWEMNGGEWAASLSQEELQVLKKLIVIACPQTITVETKQGLVGVVHAESTDDWKDNNSDTLETNTWARTKARTGNKDPIKNIDMVVVGHTPFSEVKRLGNVVYIDTGAVYERGQLTLATAEALFAT